MLNKHTDIDLYNEDDPEAREDMTDSTKILVTVDKDNTSPEYDGGTASITGVESTGGKVTHTRLTMSLGITDKTAHQRICDDITKLADELDLLDDGGFDYVTFITEVYKLGSLTSMFDVVQTTQANMFA